MNYFFTSDNHFGHRNIIKYSKRPFSSVEEMDEAMIDRWNAVVKPSDFIYHIGDFALCKADQATDIAKRLNGQKFLIFGNHDKGTRRDKTFLSQWIWAKDYANISIGDQKIILCHFAFRVWDKCHYGSWNLHGHSHGSLADNPGALQLDMGVDCWNYTPVSFDEVKQRMSTKRFVPIDHHGDREEY